LGNDRPDLRALFACESISGFSEPEIGMEHASNGKIRTVPICVCENNCKLLSLSFDLIRESASTAFDLN
jgi:hypothetical protein